MAAQLENGYTLIAHELLEALYKTRINGSQANIIMFIFRFTYGFHRKSHELGNAFISEGTGIRKDQVKREINKLIDMKIVKVFEESTHVKARVIGINTNTAEWDYNKKSTQGAKKTPGDEIEPTVGANQSPPPGGYLPPQDIYSFKDNLKDITTDENNDFEKVNKEYGRIHQCMGLKPSDWPTVTELLSKGVQAELIINVMEEKHGKKVEEGGKVHSFSFYTNAIKEKHKGIGVKNSRMSIFDELERELG
ncbi:replication protein [Paenibacillus peoriae]|uniref:replication protein n=1 Tax=Paenibacillus peoriae TaxID=59893 RepID=UPI0032AEEBB9